MKSRFDLRSASACALGAAVLALWMSAAPANAAVFTLTDGNSSSVVDSGPAGMTGWTVDGVNQMARQWFWFRVGAAGGETDLGSLPLGAAGLSDSDFNGSSETLFLRYLGGAFQADVKVILAGGSAGSGTSDLTETIKITNTSGAPLDFHFFQYANLHLGGQTVNDSVEIRGGNTAVQTCGSTIVSETADVPTPSRYEAGLAFNTLNSLTDGSPTSLSNQAGPTGPGDLTWAFQWDKTIAAGGSLLISKDMHVVPEPATLGLLVLGGLTVIARRRR